MKYTELKVDDARKICKKVHCNCDKCPIRRTRITLKNETKTLFCWFRLMDFYNTNAEEFIDLMTEEIENEKEVLKILEEINS